ncbi:MAG TPA: ADP-ribosylglycohydrolase family protein [Phycisphaerae bacterium]|nr:ADP-ribosylglycohydrolase family protein [Phycisphaerae bacterium]HOJ73037.1 ADP-ribosylglycohydrolase family protein [Phycisphaerae bacterium]HOM52654.1 ADP-ribosylglycohydrolase family protein [Phycisphaerae bacterium]HON68321.1 ADP-ribosylglycohydrolase family protein [Phycisphaerae bacterium]HOQ87800.1 ADP-ribosylglycohydrolase family protein [Phycisphaerae bacterium]
MFRFVLAALMMAGSPALAAETRTLPKKVYLDKLRGGWVGQMVGVSYGAPYEFRSPGKIDEGEIREWKPEYISNAIGQDDLYVEICWLSCLEDHGLDITFEQAGKYYGDMDFHLAHANKTGHENVRKGIMPPASGHPDNNPHANDIDYQIESDAIGLICPGLPRESNRLGNIFGHIMNYGDGVYGGLFVQGMYTAAYFESKDNLAVVEAGLACIPKESLYARCIRDVITWYKQHPNDWRATWRLIEDKYNDDRDCEPGNPFNIDAHINGAYIVMGLLYGGDDFWKVCEISMRCGQDSDCNPSSAAGVWGCMRGLSAIPAEAWAGLDGVAHLRFAHVRYNYREVIECCRKLTERIIVRNGGRVEADRYIIPVQTPVPAPLEQWESPALKPAP